MISRLHKGDEGEDGRTPKGAQPSTVVQFTDSRRAAVVPLERQLEETRELLDRGLPTTAESRLRHIIAQAQRDPAILARARYLHSLALQAG